MRGCFAVENKVSLPFYAGKSLPQYPIIMTPMYSNLIPFFWQSDKQNASLMNGCFHSPTFRKLCTVYQEFKIDGVVYKITPVKVSGVDNLNMYCMWDRSVRDGFWDFYGTGNHASRQIRDSSMEQGGYSSMISSAKGKNSFYAKCFARSVTERNTWTPIRVYSSWAKVYNASDAPNFYYFYMDNFFNNVSRSTTAFNPGVFITCEAGADSTSNSSYATFNVQAKYYISFRSPGLNSNSETTAERLLKTNNDLIPYTQDAKGNKIPAVVKPDGQPYKPEYVIPEDPDEPDDGPWIDPPLVDPDDPIDPVVPVEETKKDEEEEDVEPSTKRVRTSQVEDDDIDTSLYANM